MVYCPMLPSHYPNQCLLIIKVFFGIHLRAVSQEIEVDLHHVLEIPLLELLPQFPGANVLNIIVIQRLP